MASEAARPAIWTVHSTSTCASPSVCPLPRPGWTRAKAGRREAPTAATRSCAMEMAPAASPPSR
eukprot:1242974-Alexandrium_andersonii.AAC.1